MEGVSEVLLWPKYGAIPELQSVGRSELVFEHNLALSEKNTVLTSQVATFVPGQRCQGTES